MANLGQGLQSRPTIKEEQAGLATDLPIILCHFRTRRTLKNVNVYCLHFKQGTRSWVVERRYSEFLRCQVQLLETFRRHELPRLPPKEPVLQKMFGRGAVRSEWSEDRNVQLHQYVTELLENPRAVQARAVLQLINAPRPSMKHCGALELIAPSDTVLITGVRVRLTGEPGGIEVVVRVDASSACRVRLALRQVGRVSADGQLCEVHDASEDSRQRLLEFEIPAGQACGVNEARQRLQLEPGSLWQVTAVGLNAAGDAANAVCIQLRAPTEAEMSQLPSQRGHEEVAPTDRGIGIGDMHRRPAVEAIPSPRRRSERLEDDEEDADGSVAEAEEWTLTRSFTCESSLAGASADVEPSDDLDNEDAANESDMADKTGKVEQSRWDNIAKYVAEVKAKKKQLPGGRVARTTSTPVRLNLTIPEQRGLNGPEVHNVISYRGQAAAEYARQIEEQQKEWLERCPHRVEAGGDGKNHCVHVRISIVGKEKEAALPERQSVKVLDTSRQQQQELRLREDERAVAAWIYANTGDLNALAAAEGRCELQTALQPGDALCDLVNAVWPGRISGIRRGDAKNVTKLSNITKFLKACSDLGVGDVFTPSDLFEGKNVRSVVRCLFALAARVPEPPEFEGPRLEDSMEPLTPSCRRNIVGLATGDPVKS